MRLFISFLVLALVSVSASGETYEEFLKSQMQEFQQFKDERDKEFTQFLKEMWVKVETEEPEKRIDEPKPDVMPVAPPQPEPEPAKPEPEPEVVQPPVSPLTPFIPPLTTEKPKPAPVPEPAKPVLKEPKPAPEPSAPEIAKAPEPAPLPIPVPVLVPAPVVKPVVKGIPLNFEFFGAAVSIGYDKKLSLGASEPIDSNVITSFWEKAATADYEPLMNNLLKYKNSYVMNDWGFILLVSETCGKIARDRNGKVLLTWFVLSKAGYETRLAYDRQNVYLLLPATTRLYSVSYFTLNGKRYYAVSADGFINNLGTVYTYKKDYPEADKVMDFRMRKYPQLGSEIVEKHFKFSYSGKTHAITIPYNNYDITYFKYHPQSDVTVYAEAGMPGWESGSLLSQLKPIIKGKSELDSVNILLRFVQTAFEYATDDKQFGREKFLFPEETVYYPYSDCEDRSIFFSYLVRNLLGLDVVFLDFPGHIATAVAFNEDVKGDYFTFEGKKYTVTDPTYINANAGMTMPQFASTNPKIVKF
jgi:hypothetical protein